MSSFSALKDPNAQLDYQIDWSPWLGADQIATSVWEAEVGITVDSSSNNTTKATVWLSGGVHGENYEIRNRITTGGGRTDDRTINIEVRNR